MKGKSVYFLLFDFFFLNIHQKYWNIGFFNNQILVLVLKIPYQSSCIT